MKSRDEFEENPGEVRSERDFLSDKNAELVANLNNAIYLSYNIIKNFFPILGLRAQAVVELCRLVEGQNYFTAAEYHCLEVSAYLYNLGLIRVSRELLSRYVKHPDELSGEEEELIRKAPEYGEELAEHFLGDLKEVGRTIRAVHERWDGSGYPDGLPREMIPKLARYLAIAVYYVESPNGGAETMEEMINLSGIYFHPESLRLFLKVTAQAPLPEKVEEILFSELRPGMVLAHPIHTPTGLLLFPEDHEINEQTLEKISDFNEAEPIHDRILVYRQDNQEDELII